MKRLRRYAELLRGGDRGTVAVTFLLSLPILLIIIAVFVQYALIVNAQLAVDRAAAVAARSAMTALPTDPDVDNMDGAALVRRSALLALAPLSPVAKGDPSAEGTAIADAWRTLGSPNDQGLAGRYTYAADGATVTWQRLDENGAPVGGDDWEPADYARSPGQRVRVTVTYPFLLTVPAVNKLIGSDRAIAGVNGRVLMLTASAVVELSHGREAQAASNGWPQGGGG